MPRVDQRKLDKPFQCPVCSLRFKSRSSLADHSSEHAAPRRCSLCGKTERYPGEYCHHTP